MSMATLYMLTVVALVTSARSKTNIGSETTPGVPCRRAGGIVQVSQQENGRRKMHTHNEMQELHFIDQE